MHSQSHVPRPVPTLTLCGTLLVSLAMPPPQAHASFFEGETLDTVADVMTWIVLIVAPTVAIVVFWIVHILPEKIAERRRHPQAKAIQCLCLLSLAFGGLLWPLAWLWAYSKPVLHKMAYGTDVGDAHDHDGHGGHGEKESGTTTHTVDNLLARIAELERRLAGESAGKGRKA